MACVSKRLDELGFGVGCIVETIVVTRNPDGSPNAAPMGVMRIGEEIIEIKPFRTSTTYRNLRTGGYASANVTDDPHLFLATAFKDERPDGFEPPVIGDNLSINGADACVHVEVVERKEVHDDRGDFICRVDSIEIERPLPTVFSRGRAIAIEGIIHATRIEENIRSGRLKMAEGLMRHFDVCAEVVKKVSPPDSMEFKAIRAIEQMIKRWREEPSR